MGMSASQARMLTLTSRLSDLEYQAQSISNSKIRLADQEQAASVAYQSALDKEKLTVYNSDTNSYIDATAYNLTTYNAISNTDKQRFIKDVTGNVLVSSSVGNAYDSANGDLNTFLTGIGVTTNTTDANYDAGSVRYYTNVFNEIKSSGGYNCPGDTNMRDSEWLEEEIESGNLYLYEYNTTGGSLGTGDWENVSWTSGDASLETSTDSSEITKAEAEYNTTMNAIQAKDKRYDLQLKEINTEHTAIQTEIDSVKKVINKNVERSYKVFSA